MKTLTVSAFSLVFLFSSLANAVCPGYNYAFYDRGQGTYVISDASNRCNVVRVDNVGRGNVCTIGKYKCSSRPIRVTHIKVHNLWYKCRNDKGKGRCPGRPGAQAVPTSCCRNDGKRNLEDGLITSEEFEVIERRNAELDLELDDDDEEVADEEDADEEDDDEEAEK